MQRFDDSQGNASPISKQTNCLLVKLNPIICYAFHDDLSKSKGTLNTVKQAEKREIKVVVTGSSPGEILTPPIFLTNSSGVSIDQRSQITKEEVIKKVKIVIIK